MPPPLGGERLTVAAGFGQCSRGIAGPDSFDWSGGRPAEADRPFYGPWRGGVLAGASDLADLASTSFLRRARRGLLAVVGPAAVGPQ